MVEPYKPIHSVKWLENYLSTNYYKKKYDRFMWWRSYTLRNKPLSSLHPLKDRITNGDFNLGSYTFEIELVQHRINEKYIKLGHDQVQYIEAISLDNARIKRLQEDRDKDEKNKLEELKKCFLFYFKMSKEQYDKEVIKSHKDLLTFFFKVDNKYKSRTLRVKPVPKNW
jgi:hypothetical protein